MSDFSKALTNKHFQKEIGRLLEDRPTYLVDPDLPDTLREKLEELERVVPKRTKS